MVLFVSFSAVVTLSPPLTLEYWMHCSIVQLAVTAQGQVHPINVLKKALRFAGPLGYITKALGPLIDDLFDPITLNVAAKFFVNRTSETWHGFQLGFTDFPLFTFRGMAKAL